jgi:hypothetical protein
VGIFTESERAIMFSFHLAFGFEWAVLLDTQQAD